MLHDLDEVHVDDVRWRDWEGLACSLFRRSFRPRGKQASIDDDQCPLINYSKPNFGFPSMPIFCSRGNDVDPVRCSIPNTPSVKSYAHSPSVHADPPFAWIGPSAPLVLALAAVPDAVVLGVPKMGNPEVMAVELLLLSTSYGNKACDGGGFLGKCAGAPYFCWRESSALMGTGLGEEIPVGPLLSKGRVGGGIAACSALNGFGIPALLLLRLWFWLEAGEGFLRPLFLPPLRLVVSFGTKDLVCGLKSDLE